MLFLNNFIIFKLQRHWIERQVPKKLLNFLLTRPPSLMPTDLLCPLSGICDFKDLSLLHLSNYDISYELMIYGNLALLSYVLVYHLSEINFTEKLFEMSYRFIVNW